MAASLGWVEQTENQTISKVLKTYLPITDTKFIGWLWSTTSSQKGVLNTSYYGVFVRHELLVGWTQSVPHIQMSSAHTVGNYNYDTCGCS